MKRAAAFLAAVSLTIGVVACGDDGESETAPPEPEAPELPDVPEPGQPGEPGEATPHLVEPRPGMDGVRPLAFESAEGIEDGRVLAIRYWAGVEPCDVLDRVDVDEGDDRVTVTLQVGHEPGSEDVACILIAQFFETRVELSEPLGDRRVVDGARDAADQADLSV